MDFTAEAGAEEAGRDRAFPGGGASDASGDDAAEAVVEVLPDPRQAVGAAVPPYRVDLHCRLHGGHR